MSKNQKRLALSFILSLICALLTHIWYVRGSQISIDYGDKTPLAQLIELSNEVQRKPLKRLIWQSLSQNESLFAGEQIRTTSEAHARIQLIKTGTVIELDPDSLIVLEENDGSLGLNFLKGNLFVKGGDSSAGALKLKSGDAEIALNGAEMSLGKSEGSSLDLKVFKGQATLNANGKEINLDQSNSGRLDEKGFQKEAETIQILRPSALANVYVAINKKEPVTFEWKPLAAGYEMALELGNRRDSIKPISDMQINSNQIMTHLLPGEYYWKLVAKNKDPSLPVLQSSVYKVRILPKRPPVLLQPEKDTAFVTPQEQMMVTFRWANPAQLKNLILETAKSADFKTGYESKPLGNTDIMDVPQKGPGAIFWRISGQIEETKEMVSSEIQKFEISRDDQVKAPDLEFPIQQEKLRYGQIVRSGLKMKWKPVPGLTKYKITIRRVGENGRQTASAFEEINADSSEHTIDKIRPGTYEWQVASISPTGKVSAPSKSEIFAVVDVPQLEWADGKDQGEYHYYTDKPELGVEWTRGSAQAVKYQVKMKPSVTDGESSVQEKIVTETQLTLSVPKEGFYLVTVGAYNQKGDLISRSSERLVEVKKSALLAAPVFDATLPTPLQAAKNGTVEARWNKLEGAKAYKVEVRTKDGKSVKEEVVQGTRVNLKSLLPGDYDVVVSGIDRGNRPGATSESKGLLVPERSDVRAPKLKGIKIE